MTQYLSPVVKGRLQIAHAKQVTWYTLWRARKTMSKAEICLPQAAHALERPYILQKKLTKSPREYFRSSHTLVRISSVLGKTRMVHFGMSGLCVCTCPAYFLPTDPLHVPVSCLLSSPQSPSHPVCIY